MMNPIGVKIGGQAFRWTPSPLIKVAHLGFGTGRVCWTMTDARDARTLTRPLEAVHLSRPASSRLMLAQSTCHGSCERQIEQGVGLVWHSSDTLSTEAQRRELYGCDDESRA